MQTTWALRIAGHKARLQLFNVAGAVLSLKEPRLFVGPGSVERLASHVASFDVGRLLLVTDSGITELGLHSSCKERLEELGTEVVVYDDVSPNPTERQIEGGIARARREHCGGVLGFGGGSPMDAAKLIAAGATNDKPVAKMEGTFKVRKKPLPLFAVPTTAGTGAEVTFAAVVTDEAERRKYPVADPKLVPLAAALDPELMVGLPPQITAHTGMDALTHAVESYVCTRANEDSERAGKVTVKLIFDHLVDAFENGSDLEAREEMALAAYEGGVAFSSVGLGYVHAIAHKLGGLYHVPHGLANAVLLPHVLDYEKDACSGRLADLARVAGLDGNGAASDQALADRFIDAIRELERKLELPETIEQIESSDVPAIASAAVDEAFSLYAVPKYMRQADAERIVRAISG
jgi:alcohol dehydrogenase